MTTQSKRRSPSGAFIGAVIGALWGGIFPPAAMMLTALGGITFIICGTAIGASAGMLVNSLCRRWPKASEHSKIGGFTGAFIGTVIGALLGGIFLPERMMLSQEAAVPFILVGVLIGAHVGMLVSSLFRRSCDDSDKPAE